MKYLISKGADPSKLLIGLPFYGQSFTLKNKKNNVYGALADGPGNPGEFTRQPGMLSYYEICDKSKFPIFITRISGKRKKKRFYKIKLKL